MERVYLWQHPDWPRWRYALDELLPRIAEVSRLQGLLLGRLADVGFATRDQASLQALTEDVLQTSAIEGERLDRAAVRSSLARRLGVDNGALAPVDRRVEGVVALVLDATSQVDAQLTRERLQGWHAALFPTGHSGLSRIRVGAWRDDAEGPMQVVSGPAGRMRVHFQAPPAERVDVELERFLHWVNAVDEPTLPLLKAGVAHLWFLTVHPFEDGNGRIARAIGDWLLARADRSPQRYYSLSAQIERERRDYYEILETTQRGTPDLTRWLAWFLGALSRALQQAQRTVDRVLAKSRFWARAGGTPLSPRKLKLLNRLLDGFEGRMTSSRWATIAGCSKDSALRDIQDLLDRGLLQRLPGGGRSSAYGLPESCMPLADDPAP